MPVPAIVGAAASAFGSSASTAAGNLAAGAVSGTFSAVIGKMKEGITTLFTPISTFRTLIDQIGNSVGSLVNKANPAVFQKFTFAVDDLSAVIGRVLVPVLEVWTGVTRKVADAIASLGEGGDQVIKSFFGFEALAKILGNILDRILPPLVGIFDSLGTRLEAMQAVWVTIGDVVGNLFKHIAFAVEGLLIKTEPFIQMFAGFVQIFWEVQKAGSEIGAAFAELMYALDFVTPLIEGFVRMILDGIVASIKAAAHWIRVFADVTTWLIRSIAEIVRSFTDMFDVFGSRDRRGEVKAGSSTGAAVRNVSIGDVGSYLNKAYISAFASGAGKEGTKEDPMAAVKRDVDEIKNNLQQNLINPAKVLIKDATVFINELRSKAEQGKAVANAAGTAASIGANIAMPGLGVARETMRYLGVPGLS